MLATELVFARQFIYSFPEIRDSIFFKLNPFDVKYNTVIFG